jgi:hypothetical protein
MNPIIFIGIGAVVLGYFLLKTPSSMPGPTVNATTSMPTIASTGPVAVAVVAPQLNNTLMATGGQYKPLVTLSASTMANATLKPGVRQ